MGLRPIEAVIVRLGGVAAYGHGGFGLRGHDWILRSSGMVPRLQDGAHLLKDYGLTIGFEEAAEFFFEHAASAPI